MSCLCKIQFKSVVQGACVAVVALVLAGDVAALAYGYHYQVLGVGGDDWFGLHLLKGGTVLCSVLLPLALGCLVPERASVLCRVWLAVHITWSDDWARHAVLVLYRLQVTPVVDALGLASYTAAFTTLHYWWWAVQGLLLVIVAQCLVASFSPSQEALDDETEDEVAEVVVLPCLLGPREEVFVDMPDLLDICCGHQTLALTME